MQVIQMTRLTAGKSPLAFGPDAADAVEPGAKTMIHFVLHDARDTVAVVVVEGVKAGAAMQGWIMDEDRMVGVTARQDIPIGHKVALKDMAVGDTVLKYGIDMGKVVAPIKAGEHAHVQNIKTKRW
jgi:(2R)-sulfolactate sulfo-lyase subunit alpha